MLGTSVPKDAMAALPLVGSGLLLTSSALYIAVSLVGVKLHVRGLGTSSASTSTTFKFSLRIITNLSHP